MLKPNAEQMLRLGKDCGLTWVMEAYNQYLLHYTLFFSIADHNAQLKALHEEMIQMEILGPNGNGGFEIRDIEIDKVLDTIPRKPLVIYHKNCSDGFGAMWCFWNKHKDTYEYVPGTYANSDFDIELYRNREVYLVDFSYKRSVVEEILKVSTKVHLIDHHKSALDDLAGLEGLDFTISTNEHSGAMLAWMYLNPGVEAPWAITLIEDRDLWKFNHEATKDFSQYLLSLDYDINVWNKAIDDAEEAHTFFAMCKEGAAIERKHMKDVRELLNQVTRHMKVSGYDIPVANVPHTMASDAGNMLSRDEPFAATYYDTEHGRHFSLRSHKDNPQAMDVSKIAFEYGGGGHKHASGFKVPRDHVLAKE